MDLVADIGNTKTKLRYFDKNCEIVISEEIINTDDELLKSDFFVPNRAILCNVSSRQSVIVNLLENNGIIPIIMSPKLLLPVVIKYKTPETLGGDRIAAVVGAVFLYPCKNILVIDAGTAITYDYVDTSANYLGGNISPGLLLRYKSLHDYTGNLPLLAPRESYCDIATSTEDAIAAGVQKGAVLEMKNYIDEWCNKSRNNMVILTGGDASYFVNSIKSSIFVNFDLVSIGLKRILDLNAK